MPNAPVSAQQPVPGLRPRRIAQFSARSRRPPRRADEDDFAAMRADLVDGLPGIVDRRVERSSASGPPRSRAHPDLDLRVPASRRSVTSRGHRRYCRAGRISDSFHTSRYGPRTPSRSLDLDAFDRASRASSCRPGMRDDAAGRARPGARSASTAIRRARGLLSSRYLGNALLKSEKKISGVTPHDDQAVEVGVFGEALEERPRIGAGQRELDRPAARHFFPDIEVRIEQDARRAEDHDAVVIACIEASALGGPVRGAVVRGRPRAGRASASSIPSPPSQRPRARAPASRWRASARPGSPARSCRPVRDASCLPPRTGSK